MRKFINLIELTEAALTPSTLAKHNGKYLSILIQLIGTGAPIQVDPQYRIQFGNAVQLDPAILPQLTHSLSDPATISNTLPKVVKSVDGKIIPWGAIFKGAEFKAGAKAYNTGHVAELFMGASVATKFANVGVDITSEQVIATLTDSQTEIQGKNYKFEWETTITYPEVANKIDSITFLAVVNALSAEAVFNQLATNKFEADLTSVLSSAVRYANESEGVALACQRIRADKENNTVEIISDGSSDNKGTKADLILKIDGAKVNLLSLKTYNTSTLGQISGLSYTALSTWFTTNFDIDISEYEGLLDPALGNDRILKNLLTKIYDEVVYPQVKKMCEEQTPSIEATVVKRFANAAHFYARGTNMEEVEIVKLDDKITTGNYKILRFTDSLYDAMKHLDLEVKYVSTGEFGRTIQIWVKPDPDTNVAKGANKLCQFRTQRTGGYTRNYFESGSMLEALTEVESSVSAPLPRAKRKIEDTPREKR